MKNNSLIYKKSISSIKWNYLGVFARIVMQLVIQTYIARKIGPEEYGVFAAIVLLTGIVCIVIEAGVGALIIKSSEISFAKIKKLMFLNFSIATGFSLLLTVFFDDGVLTLVGVNRAVGCFEISLVFIFYSFSCVPSAVLRKMFFYKQIQAAQNFSYALCFGVFGFFFVELEKSFLAPLYSLIIFNITFSSILFFIFISKNINYSEKSSENFTLLFGSVFSNMQNWIIENIDNYIIGRLMGSVSLGYYAVSYNFVRSPANSFVATFQSVAFSAFSATEKNDKSKNVDAYCVSIAMIFFVASILFGLLFLFSHYVVFFLYGEQWIYAANVLEPLALAMIFHSVMAVAGPLLVASGGIKKDIFSQSISALVMAVAIYTYCHAGGEIVGAAWVVCGVYFFRCLVINIFVVNHFKLTRSYTILNIASVFLFIIIFSGALFFVGANDLYVYYGVVIVVFLWIFLFLMFCFLLKKSAFSLFIFEKFIVGRFK